MFVKKSIMTLYEYDIQPGDDSSDGRKLHINGAEQ
jgi:hypothetical protein